MNFDKYQDEASKTAVFESTVKSLSAEDAKAIYVLLGLSGEVGELVEKVKKGMRNGESPLEVLQTEASLKEMGDVLWYLSNLARLSGHKLSEVGEANLRKLFDRQDRGVLNSEGDDR